MPAPHAHRAGTDYLGKSGAKDLVGGDPLYGDWLYQGDDMLGQILNALDRQGLAENTLVIATSDNGAEHRAYPPLRGSKRSIYEGGHRVPFVARWPGKVKAGATHNDTVCLNDLMATAADLVGARLPDNAGEDSVSLLPALLGTPGAHRATRRFTSPRRVIWRSARATWKLVFLSDGTCELYDLSTDLGESQDVSAANPERIARLTQLMRRFIERGRSTPGGIQKNDAVISLGEKGKEPTRKFTPGDRKKPRP